MLQTKRWTLFENSQRASGSEYADVPNKAAAQRITAEQRNPAERSVGINVRKHPGRL